jgi:hypothetical protein
MSCETCAIQTLLNVVLQFKLMKPSKVIFSNLQISSTHYVLLYILMAKNTRWGAKHRLSLQNNEVYYRVMFSSTL